MVPGDLVVDIQVGGAVQLGDKFALDGRAGDGMDGVVFDVRFDDIGREGGVEIRDALWYGEQRISNGLSAGESWERWMEGTEQGGYIQ